MRVNSKLLTRLTLTGMKNNRKRLIPFLMAATFTIMIFYILTSLAYTPYIISNGEEAFYGARTIAIMLKIGSRIVAFVSAIFIIYANQFVMKSRKKEMALYGVLGMSKRNITFIMILETVINILITVGIGILAGTFLNKISLLILYKIIKQTPVNGILFETKALINTVVLFGRIFLICLIINVTSIRVGNPITMLKSDKTGEKEPKVKVFTFIIGIITLGAGYYIALTTHSTFAAAQTLIISILLVIIGTYCLFIAGSIFILKMLKKNERFYYKTRNFISVSNLIYRMKHNAAGLASICILSTAVILLLTCGSSLMLLGENNINNMYPTDVRVKFEDDEKKPEEYYTNIINNAIKKSDVNNAELICRQYESIMLTKEGDSYIYINYLGDIDNNKDVYMVALDDYNRYIGKDIKLADDEILVYTTDEEYKENNQKIMNICDHQYNVVGEADYKALHYIFDPIMALFERYIIVFKNEEDIDSIISGNTLTMNNSEKQTYIGYDIKGTLDKNSMNIFKETVNSIDGNATVSFKEEERTFFYNIYGGAFFVGIFMAILFLIATVMIIYYKQMSEGYEDQKRFEILAKVGLTEREAKKTIKRQVMILFFMPVIAAIIHSVVATRIIRLFLRMILVVDSTVFAAAIGIVCIIFFVIYAIVYKITSGQYYRIVYANVR